MSRLFTMNDNGVRVIEGVKVRSHKAIINNRRIGAMTNYVYLDTEGKSVAVLGLDSADDAQRVANDIRKRLVNFNRIYTNLGGNPEHGDIIMYSEGGLTHFDIYGIDGKRHAVAEWIDGGLCQYYNASSAETTAVQKTKAGELLEQVVVMQKELADREAADALALQYAELNRVKAAAVKAKRKPVKSVRRTR